MERAGVAVCSLALLLLAIAAPCVRAEAARRSWRSEGTSAASQHAPARKNAQPDAVQVSEQSQCTCPELPQPTCKHSNPPPGSLLPPLDVLLVSHSLVLALGFWLGKSRARTQQTPPPQARTAAASTGPRQQPVETEHLEPAPAHSHCNGSASAIARAAARAQPPSVHLTKAASPSKDSSRPLDASEPAAAAASPHSNHSASPLGSVVNACVETSPNSSSAAMHKAGAEKATHTPEQQLQHEQLHGSQEQCAHQQEEAESCSQQAVQEKCGEQQQAPHQPQIWQREEGEHGGQAAALQECSYEQHQGQQEKRGQDEQPQHANARDQLPPSTCSPPRPSPPPPQLISSPGAWPELSAKGADILTANGGDSLAPVQQPSTHSSQHALTTLANQLNLLLNERMATDKLQIVHHHEHTHSLDPRSYEQARQLAGELQAMADRGVAAQSLRLGAQHLGTMSQSLQQCAQFVGDAFAFVHKWYAGQMMKQQKELCTRCLQGGFCIMLLVLVCSAFAHGRLSRLVDLTATCSSKGVSSAWFSPSRWAFMLLTSGGITGRLGWVLCAANELGLFGLGVTGFVMAALKVPGLLTDVHHSWQFYLPVCMGCAGGYAGTNLVSALGGAWLVWLVLWEAWVVVCCGMYAWEVSSWKARSLLVFVLSVALPCPMGFMPFHWTAEMAERFLLQGLSL